MNYLFKVRVGMEKFVINGGRKLKGSVKVDSAKNAVLPMIAAAILTEEETVIKNCPPIGDVVKMTEILRSCGAKTAFCDGNLIINAKDISINSVSEKLCGSLRTSVLMLGALAGRTGGAAVYRPGGCNIGKRPVDIHLYALKTLGSSVYDESDRIICCGKPSGGDVYLDFPSVGATENALLASVTAKGVSRIFNPAKEPEIEDFVGFLNAMGAKVYGAGSSCIRVEGVKRLHGAEYTPIGDRIEAGTYLIASAITGGEIAVEGVNAENISSLTGKLCDNSCQISVGNGIIYQKSIRGRKAFDAETGPYPSFPTDLQAQITSLAAVSEGTSVIRENVFETRFGHVAELVKMGADITVDGRTETVRGVKKLHGAVVSAKDLRCGAAMVIAGLAAEGQTIVLGAHHVERGYYDVHKKLAGLGADIRGV